MEENILELIEERYDVKSLKHGNTRVWPLLRKRIYFGYIKKKLNASSKRRTRKIQQLFKNFFYGAQNIFKIKRFEYLFFENTNKRILLNGKFYDIYFDAWADRLGQEKSLFIEFAMGSYYSINHVHSKNIISDLPFKLASAVASLLSFPYIRNKELLGKIQKEMNVETDLAKEVKSQLGEYYFYKFLFNHVKPKAVFVLSSFTKVSIVMAAKSANVKVYEAQHGFVGKSHPFYHVRKERFEESYPNYLFSFGEYERNKNDHFIFKKHQIIPIGGLELEHWKGKQLPEELQCIKDKFRRIFCITLQDIKEKELIESTIDFANKNPDNLFVLCPKNRNNTYSNFLELPNFYLSSFSIYDVLKISDYNITIFSTTAIEGHALGVPPIFYNVDNLSKKYFNISELNGSLIEEDKLLTENHLIGTNKRSNLYYIEGYFDNVKKCKVDL